MHAIRLLFALVAALLFAAACGTRGDLTRPPGPAPKPVLDEWLPAQPAKAKTETPAAKDSKPAAAEGQP